MPLKQNVFNLLSSDLSAAFGNASTGYALHHLYQRRPFSLIQKKTTTSYEKIVRKVVSITWCPWIRENMAGLEGKHRTTAAA